MTPDRRRSTLLQSFNHAFQGLVYAVRHQRNMRIHLVIAVGVLVGSILMDLTKLELLAVLLSVMFVLVTELFNSAVETAVDMLTDQYDPRAKAAKDLSAGAVLVAAMNALVVAYLVLADRLTGSTLRVLTAITDSPPHLTAIAFAVVMAAVIALKATRKKGTPLSGGPSLGARGSGLRRLDRHHLRGGQDPRGSAGEHDRPGHGVLGGSKPRGDGHPLAPRGDPGGCPGCGDHHADIPARFLDKERQRNG